MHKDPRNQEIKAHSRKRLQVSWSIDKIGIVDNRKIKIIYNLMIWSMATPHWSWDRILDSVGAGKNYPSWAEAMDGQKSFWKERLGKWA